MLSGELEQSQAKPEHKKKENCPLTDRQPSVSEAHEDNQGAIVFQTYAFSV